MTAATPRFRQYASRYSRFVSAMKLLLPTVALVLIALVLVWPRLAGKDGSFRIGFSGREAREATDLSMVNARYLGTDNDNQPFSVTADIVRNVTPSASVVELDMPKADLSLTDGTWVVLTADSGRYDQDQQLLDLTGSVHLFHDAGYEMQTTAATINLEAGTAEGDQPVRGQGPFGRLEAEGFRLQDKGKSVLFTGKSHLILYPGAEKP